MFATTSLALPRRLHFRPERTMLWTGSVGAQHACAPFAQPAASWRAKAFPPTQTSVNLFLCGGSSSVGRASDCGSECRGFESRLPPQSHFEPMVHLKRVTITPTPLRYVHSTNRISFRVRGQVWLTTCGSYGNGSSFHLAVGSSSWLHFLLCRIG